MYKPLISIIVPIYNVESYVNKCIDSILNQTYKNIEIILVDDGSSDGCGAICDEYANQDKRIIIVHQDNKGLSGARNAALDIAKGDYILFVDGDDWIEHNTCELLLKNAIEQQADLVSFGYNKVFSTVNRESFVIDTPGIKSKVYVMRQLIWHGWKISDVVWNKIYSRNLFDGIRFPLGRQNEDLGTLYRLIHNAHTIYMSNDVLYNYTQREGSITKNNNYYREHEDQMFFYEERLRFLRVNYPELVDIQLSMILKRLLIDKHRISNSSYNEEINKELVALFRENKTKILKILNYYCYYYIRAFLLRIKRNVRKLTFI